MTEEKIKSWMKTRIKSGHFNTAADLAREFLDTNHITDATDPAFKMVINVGFEMAQEFAKIE